MCGIVGLVSTTPVADRSRLELARDTIVHRGPDSAGVWWSADQRIGFAHRRLAIIDLSPAGHQPMESPERDTVIVFNGEIYNYQDLRRELQQKGHVFRSQSDTEVILAAYREWGDDCIARLNGAFAFAIHDIARQRVLMARDRAGEKPLFYAADRDGLRFGSEIKALLTLVPQAVRVNALALDCYLGSGYVPRDLCMVEGIHKLQPGQSLAYDLASATCRCWQYWDLPEPMFSYQALEDQR